MILRKWLLVQGMLPDKTVHIFAIILTFSLHLMLLGLFYSQPLKELSIGENGIIIDLQGESEQQAQKKSQPGKVGRPEIKKPIQKPSTPKKTGDAPAIQHKPEPDQEGTESLSEDDGNSVIAEDNSKLPQDLNQYQRPQDDTVPYLEERSDGKSPLFTELPEKEEEQETPEEEIPEEIKKTMRGQQPEKTDNEQLQYTLNSYEWSFTDFAVGWAKSLQRWWRAPADYLARKIPEGGSVWIRVRIDKKGRLMEYKVYKSKVTPEMELRVVQALISSFDRPPLPDDFPLDDLVVNWRFIYPAINANVKLKKDD